MNVLMTIALAVTLFSPASIVNFRTLDSVRVAVPAKEEAAAKDEPVAKEVSAARREAAVKEAHAAKETSAAKDSAYVKPGKLLRGATLSVVDLQDSLILVNYYHLSHIIDLRSEGEISVHRDKAVGTAQYHWLPAIDPETMKGFGMGRTYSGVVALVEANACDVEFQGTVRAMYDNLALGAYSRKKFSEFLKIIVEADGGTVYWHCSQGKDRTGMATAILLMALGADKQTITDEFAKSNDTYAALVEQVWSRVKQNCNTPAAREVVEAMVGVSVSNFKATLDKIIDVYGSFDAYLKEGLDLSDQERTVLCNEYLQ